MIGLTVGTSVQAQTVNFDREFEAISQKCAVPRGWLSLSSDGFVRLIAPEDARYDDLICVLDELRDRELPMKVAYIGSVR